MTTITATKGELVNLINGLFKVQELKGKKFGLAVSKNLTILKKELQDLEDMGKPSDEFIALATKVNEISKDGSEDSKNQIDILEKENAVLVQHRRDQMDYVTSLMEEELSVELNIITEDMLPADISASQINNLINIIE